MLKRKNQIKNKKDSKSRLILVGSFLIILGTFVIGGKYLYNYFQAKNEEQLIDTFFEEQKEITENTNPEAPEEKEVSETPTSTNSKTNYFAVIKIPKIGLEKGLASKGSYDNNVNRNILVLNESDMPDKEKGNVILAGHSGSGRTAYFKNLHKLQANDEVSIFYNGHEYKYKVVNQYDIEKTGTANIVRNAEKSTLTLITCRHNTNKQIIYICELVEIV